MVGLCCTLAVVVADVAGYDRVGSATYDAILVIEVAVVARDIVTSSTTHAKGDAVLAVVVADIADDGHIAHGRGVDTGVGTVSAVVDTDVARDGIADRVAAEGYAIVAAGPDDVSLDNALIAVRTQYAVRGAVEDEVALYDAVISGS